MCERPLGRVRPQQRLGGLLDSSGPPVDRVEADEDSASRAGAADDCATRSGLAGVMGETARFRRGGSALSDLSSEPCRFEDCGDRHTIVLSSAVDLGSRVHDGFAKLRAEPPRKAPSPSAEDAERGFLAEFTVLIEGASGPEPHPSFIDLFCVAPVRDRHGTVERAGKDAAWASLTRLTAARCRSVETVDYSRHQCSKPTAPFVLALAATHRSTGMPSLLMCRVELPPESRCAGGGSLHVDSCFRRKVRRS